jgi:hypothetical protein
MMKQETIIRAQKVLAMLNLLQEEIDELAQEKAFFRHELKMTGKAFARELEKQIKELYSAMDTDAELFYYSEIMKLEETLKYHFTEHYTAKQA